MIARSAVPIFITNGRLRSTAGSHSNHLPDLNDKWLNLSGSLSQFVQAAVKNLERFRMSCCIRWLIPINQVARIFYRVDIDVFFVYQLYFESKEHGFRSKNVTMCASGCEKSAIFQKELCHTVVLTYWPIKWPDFFSWCILAGILIFELPNDTKFTSEWFRTLFWTRIWSFDQILAKQPIRSWLLLQNDHRASLDPSESFQMISNHLIDLYTSIRPKKKTFESNSGQVLRSLLKRIDLLRSIWRRTSWNKAGTSS